MQEGGGSVRGKGEILTSEGRFKSDSGRRNISGVKPQVQFQQYLGEFGGICNQLSEYKLKKLMKVISTARKRRFKHGDNLPKYGNMNKGFTEYEVQEFSKTIKNPKHFLLFKFQAEMGLRISEAVKVNVNDINIQTRELKIYAPKTGRTDFLLIPMMLFNTTLKYYEKYEEAVKADSGYLFRISTNYARNLFRRYCNKAGLIETYGMADESIRDERELHRLTTHSLRHYAITKFYNAVKDQQATKMFARHTKSSTTDTYIHKTKDEVYRAIDWAFK